MPLYEYYCKHCDGIFESIRQMSEASSPAPCPVCTKKAQRVPPSSFAARTMREGYPRAIPDRGTYWHLGKEVKSRISGQTRMNEHPELAKPQPRKTLSKGEKEIQRERAHHEAKDEARKRKDGAPRVIDNTKRLPKYK
jgi:putative FmdB family regulatory protein